MHTPVEPAATGALAASKPQTTFALSPQVILALAICSGLFVLATCSIFLGLCLRRCYGSSRRGFSEIEDGHKAPRILLLSSHSKPMASIEGHGLKKLVLPMMATVRSARGKASLFGRLIGKRRITALQKDLPFDSEFSLCNSTLVGSDATSETKARRQSLRPDWALDHLLAFRAAQAVDLCVVPEDISLKLSEISVDDASSIASLQVKQIPNDPFSFDIADMPSSTSYPTAMCRLIDALDTVQEPAPAIVVDHCEDSDPFFLTSASTAIHTHLQVPAPHWGAREDKTDREPARAATHLSTAARDIYTLAPVPRRMKHTPGQASTATPNQSGPVGLGISMPPAVAPLQHPHWAFF